MKEMLSLSDGTQTFADIIKRNNIYVDKTNYIEKLIDRGGKTCFLTRPRRFGKSLTVSTLESLFLGDKKLFRGLAIENRLNDPNYAPRPVIKLDMTSTVSLEGHAEFRNSLVRRTAFIADLLKINVSKDMPPAEMLHDLIIKFSIENKSQIAILIDEYDTPLTNNLDQIKEYEKIWKVLREFYTQLKVCDQYISFVFVTGITKNIQGGLYSAFNNPTDISYSPNFGGITGFTHDEIQLYFQPQLKELARRNNITQGQVLDKMKEHYNGFCFDGETMLYNPYSTLLLFENNEFINFWFNSGTSEQLISFLKENHLTVEQFRGVTIDRDRIINPRQNRNEDPEAYLYQLGYLSRRPAPSSETVILDYPNAEVRGSMARRLLESYFKSAGEAQKVRNAVRTALSNRDYKDLIKQINLILKSIPHSFYGKKSHDEAFYCHFLYTAFYCLDLDPRAEKASHLGRADFIITYGGQTWVIEVKINKKNTGDITLATKALDQILRMDYGGAYENPLRLGLVVGDKARAVTAYDAQDGSSRHTWARKPPPSYAKKPPKKETPVKKPVGRP
jgi:hypothetical protein